MAREQFISILAFLHINNNSTFVPHGQPDHDPLHKIRPFVNHLNAKFKEVYQPQREQQLQGHKAMLLGTCRKNHVGMPADLFEGRQQPGDFTR
ncbi:PiggyBac transposase Uribo2 [Elysia marginata]|uniref:PiggyBac transposase Uribo2 n=1 Tax=Elysia marginata TaxID=1093978 RepID=A0AAV4GRA1_9GAST|nr:PiggyBac transposase Uribo2 [Elysia marginata]